MRLILLVALAALSLAAQDKTTLKFQQSPTQLNIWVLPCEMVSTKGLNKYGGHDPDWYKVKNCKAITGEELTSLYNYLGEQRNADAHCGDWGPWIVDQHGKIMGKYRNPPCPKEPVK